MHIFLSQTQKRNCVQRLILLCQIKALFLNLDALESAKATNSLRLCKISLPCEFSIERINCWLAPKIACLTLFCKLVAFVYLTLKHWESKTRRQRKLLYFFFSIMIGSQLAYTLQPILRNNHSTLQYLISENSTISYI